MRDGKRPSNALRSDNATTIPYNPLTESKSGRWIRPRQELQKVYDAEEKASILALYAFSTHLGQTKFARMVGVKQNQISEWSRGINISNEILAMADDYKERIKEKIESILEQSLDAMPDKVEKASYWDLARTMGLAFDKLQLIEGKPTTITGNELPSNERARVIFALLESAKQKQLDSQIVDAKFIDKEPSALEASEIADADEWNTI